MSNATAINKQASEHPTLWDIVDDPVAQAAQHGARVGARMPESRERVAACLRAGLDHHANRARGTLH